ncbi:1-aminocyclopropane-1-carboxylate deaminase/D-cysteine desulfhydrase [Shewanella intestini]|uniref:1-aminocyclopropane-1-carboxylate deaminase/D-cysteine desulfhydrase n=1 Tax=Shewanella intestini TaxID=2017544 RepID=A0ABS5HZG6_9GAMM|nr:MULTISPECIES: 1-aminocyclopropane-1-carboxylate deaminase/D-cysteine desulfhydrase [Shewanella]MBR9727056.1 1-aminocyclopropane-1-carboxylate deaminase/D-cysteine desulfhydrase [Shewanella intestini]MRG35857.1 1-aminocyclopropane-1-carboxylate deaminase/D-cysteine desulfhydrase [Shewanella sp. XMDDZSB0408]
MNLPSPIESITFENQCVFVKRDDLIDDDFSGNKARKFDYFFNHDFPNVKRIIGSGSAQANSLYSLSVLAKIKGWQLDFYVDHIPSYLAKNPQGNYLGALEHGANVISVSEHPQFKQINAATLDLKMAQITQHYLNDNDPCTLLFVAEGGRCEYAKQGVEKLGQEIIVWALAQRYQQCEVFLPAGTGTTALYLQRFFNHHDTQGVTINVLTCATVGNDDYLRQQFSSLETNTDDHPHIINNGKKYHFGKLDLSCYRMWQHVCQQGIEFDMLYDPVGFLVLQHYLRQKKSATHEINWPLLYIHQGGLKGNKTMLARYKRKFGE